MASGASGPSAISSNSIMPAIPRGSFSRISWASALLVTFMMKTTPYPSVWKNHCSIFPARWLRTVARTSKGRTSAMASGVPLDVTEPMARILVVGPTTAASAGGISAWTRGFLASDIQSFLFLVGGTCELLAWSREQQTKWADRAEWYELECHQPG